MGADRLQRGLARAGDTAPVTAPGYPHSTWRSDTGTTDPSPAREAAGEGSACGFLMLSRGRGATPDSTRDSGNGTAPPPGAGAGGGGRGESRGRAPPQRDLIAPSGPAPRAAPELLAQPGPGPAPLRPPAPRPRRAPTATRVRAPTHGRSPSERSPPRPQAPTRCRSVSGGAASDGTGSAEPAGAGGRRGEPDPPSLRRPAPPGGEQPARGKFPRCGGRRRPLPRGGGRALRGHGAPRGARAQAGGAPRRGRPPAPAGLLTPPS